MQIKVSVMVDQDDWRLTNQEQYLKGVNLNFSKYSKYREGWDHDHCEFCFAKFMESDSPDMLREGYTTEDNYRWVCQKCFEDFKVMFQWKVVP